MSIAAKCVCGKNAYYCTGQEGCPKVITGIMFPEVEWGNNYTAYINKLKTELEEARKEIARLQSSMLEIAEKQFKEIERLKGLIVEIRGIAGRPLQENALLDYDDRLNKIMILCLKSNTNQ